MHAHTHAHTDTHTPTHMSGTLCCRLGPSISHCCNQCTHLQGAKEGDPVAIVITKHHKCHITYNLLHMPSNQPPPITSNCSASPQSGLPHHLSSTTQPVEVCPVSDEAVATPPLPWITHDHQAPTLHYRYIAHVRRGLTSLLSQHLLPSNDC